MALTGNDRAILTARLGAARLGASRLGFTPRDTNAQSSPGTPGPYYIWRTVALPTTTWTTVKS